jgi:uncharacterized protein (DUF2384 family)
MESGERLGQSDVWTIVPSTQRDRVRVLRRLATIVLEDDKSADRWMRSEVIALGKKRPIDIGKTAEGFAECRAVLGRLEHGVFS